jgi:uroporphyrinogen decarboxylase
MTKLTDYILSSTNRSAMPIAVYPGAESVGATVAEVVTDADIQFNAQREIHTRYDTRIVQSAMDLSVEAEAFGSEIHVTEHEIPTVRNRLVSTGEEIDALAVPKPGYKRTQVYLDTVRRCTGLERRPFILGGMIGPFSLAGRLFGVSESLELTATDPELMHRLIRKSTDFLIAYAGAFKEAGAQGVLIAEPTAGLLSPRSLGAFSSAYVKKINDAVGAENFTVILHNCAARIQHLPAVLESGVSMLHFGAPMDIVGALQRVPETIILMGNLDPAGVFLNGSAAQVFDQTQDLLRATSAYPNFVISSGCDIPPGVTMEKLDAFYRAVAGGER